MRERKSGFTANSKKTQAVPGWIPAIWGTPSKAGHTAWRCEVDTEPFPETPSLPSFGSFYTTGHKHAGSALGRLNDKETLSQAAPPAQGPD